MKYVQNVYTSDIQLNLKSATGSAVTSVVFRRQNYDRMTGQLIATGYNEIDDAIFERLQESKAFNKCVSEGKLVICDEPPITVNTVDRLMKANEEISKLRAENKALAEELAALKAKNEKPKSEKPKKGGADTPKEK